MAGLSLEVNKKYKLTGDREQELQLVKAMTGLGFFVAFLLMIVLFYLPHEREVVTLQVKQLELERELAFYNGFSQTFNIPGPEMLPQILEDYRQSLQQAGIEVKSINVEKFSSSDSSQLGLSYALVRVNLKSDPMLADKLNRLGMTDDERVLVIEEIKMNWTDTRLLLKIYFST